jgi:hypothetical protein
MNFTYSQVSRCCMVCCQAPSALEVSVGWNPLEGVGALGRRATLGRDSFGDRRASPDLSGLGVGRWCSTVDIAGKSTQGEAAPKALRGGSEGHQRRAEEAVGSAESEEGLIARCHELASEDERSHREGGEHAIEPEHGCPRIALPSKPMLE